MLSGRYLRNKVNPFGSLSIQPLYENEKCVRTRYRTGVREMNCTGKDKYFKLESAESARGKEMFHSLGAAGRDSFQPFASKVCS